ncbi:hypothetical protein [Haliangium sp.]|uniref:hypothetical protein n=1 Tax=Haliangium sp. TaxID=2663208 RepID=UPI003D0F3A4F
MAAPHPHQLESFYASALAGLYALDARPGQRRRFGAEADARWKGFAGELTAPDRLDLVLRDAAVQHAAAFAPRVVFALAGLADDEPFGPDWPGWHPHESEAAFRAPAEPDTQRALRDAAAAWHLEPQPIDPTALAAISPASSIVAAGAGAVLALAAHFDGAATLDLADQVLVITGHPGQRQLFGLAVALVGGSRPAQLLAPTDDLQALTHAAEAAGFRRLDLALVSADAPPPARAAAEAVATALRA